MTPAESRSVLVVDDDRDIRSALTEILGEEGYAVAVAANGLEALAYLKQAPALPALILLDIMMPSMNGTQFRVQQRKNPAWSGIPVILMTATSQSELASMLDGVHLDGLTLDGMRYLRKPVDLRVLLQLMATN